jgi:hypothetical protein
VVNKVVLGVMNNVFLVWFEKAWRGEKSLVKAILSDVVKEIPVSCDM